MDENSLIFLSYASPDYERVHEYYQSLISFGLDPWLDKEKLVPGQNWNFEIQRALGRAAIIVIFLSEHSVTRRGYVQREIRIALDQAQAKLHDDIYVIPVMLDEVPIPEQLTSIQVLRHDVDDPYKKLSRAIETQLGRLNLESAKLQGDPKLRWTLLWCRDQWEGLPGYEIAYQIPRFASDQYPQVTEITDVIRGWAAAQAMNEREVKFFQSPESLSFGQPTHSRTNSWEAACNIVVQERIVSISYSVWTMGARAAHPNMHFKTFAFTLSPVGQISSLASLFVEPESALAVIQGKLRHQLLHANERFPTDGSEGEGLDQDWVNRGTESWEDFSAFTFTAEGIEFLFSPYQVGCYADGPQFAKIAYEDVAALMLHHYACSLGIEFLRHRMEPVPPLKDATTSDAVVAAIESTERQAVAEVVGKTGLP